MPDNDCGPDKDEPPAESPVGSQGKSEALDAPQERQAARNTSRSVLDEFGLPAKDVQQSPPEQRSVEEHRPTMNGQHNKTSDGRAPESHMANETYSVEGDLESSEQPPRRDSISPTREASNEASTIHPETRSTKDPVGAPSAPQPASDHVTPAAAIVPAGGVSEWSHQALASQKVEENQQEEEEWRDMPAYAQYDLYDDDGKLIARQARESDDEDDAYAGLGGAGKGYTKVQIDDDAKSTTSMDENTSYLFKEKGTNVVDEDEEQRDPLAQMKATKDMLTEGQRIAYVGVARIAMAQIVKELEDLPPTRSTKKELGIAIDATKMWSQKMMVRLYAHMEIDSSEQVMIEQLAEHGVQPGDLTPALMQNARVHNPMANEVSSKPPSISSPRPDTNGQGPSKSPALSVSEDNSETHSLPAYEEHKNDFLPEVRSPSQLGVTRNIDIDLRWTVLCDIFLVLIADSLYDSRSRLLLERVGASMDVNWLDICRFEKRVTDALEMQEAASKETWDEAAHMENRRKMALKRKYMIMGLATVGGSLVIGLSAGLLAPVIGAGLAAGFTTFGVAGTSGFLAGAGGTALITSGATIAGGSMAVKASHRRMGAVQTFEYRPLHNNKRVNLIVAVPGWMSGKVDDVRLPFSTVDPIMGDMYSVLWEPEMLQSTGQTINILATEALTQGLQQVLGSTILVALMASLQLPIVLSKLTYLIDNPWTVSLGRANAAGLILADSLIDRNLGARPITLVGFSLGSRVIFSCLRELAKKAAFGLVQNVYLFGSPIVANKDEYLRARMVVSGRFVNGYATNDWILGYLFRATSGGISRVSGLAQVEGVPGLENIDVTELVNGHMAYRAAMPKLLRRVGWEVESDEFTEIEDPDPDNHNKRQRELIREIDDARKDAEAKPEKKRFGFFNRGKLAQKKGWETYDESRAKDSDDFSIHSTGDGSQNVLFDIDAIRAELASEQIEVKQLESTLPPMKVQLNGSTSSAEWHERQQQQESPYLNLRETKSYEGNLPVRPTLNPTRTSPSNGSGLTHNPFDGGYDGYDTPSETAEHITMSFDEARPKLNTSTSSLKEPSTFPTSSPLSRPLPDSTPDDTTPQRPAISSAQSTSSPIGDGSGLPGLEHNAWADEEDDEFGREKEVVEMTFA